MHINTKIRNEIKKILDNSPEFSNIPVYNSRINRLSDNFPCVSIHTVDDTGTKTPDEGTYVKKIDVFIVLYDNGKDAIDLLENEKSIDEKIDDLREKLDNILLKKWETLNKVVFKLNYVGNKQVIEDNSEEIIESARTKWIAIYNQGTIG